MPDTSLSPAPVLVAAADGAGSTLILFPRTDALPAVWVGPAAAAPDPRDAAVLLAAVRPCPLLPEHGEGWFGRPGLAGHRLRAGTGPAGAENEPAAGRDWSPLFRPGSMTAEDGRIRIEAADPTAGLGLVTEVESAPGGAVRARHTLTNLGADPYVVDALEVVFPLPSRVGEVLDFTGRQTAERIPQRHRLR